MPYNPALHRRSLRLRDYDYRQNGAYFVTICTYHRQLLFGDITDQGEVQVNRYGQIVLDCWNAIPFHFPNVETDAFVVMPNHLHGILVIVDDPAMRTQHAASLQQSQPQNSTQAVSNTFARVDAGSLSASIRSFKSAVSRRSHELGSASEASVWQGRFHDKIIRNEVMLNAIRQYIEANPLNWAFDEENPLRQKDD